MPVVACLGVLVTVAIALSWVVATFSAHRAAQSAADFAALAGAAAVQSGSADPCARAGALASANGARLTTCVRQSREVEVGVEVEGPRWWGRHVTLRARARAGPVTDP